MIAVTADTLEAIAFATGAEISMGGKYPTVTVDRLTFAALPECAS